MNKKDNSRKLWTILVFMIWHKIYIEGAYDFTYLDEKPSEKEKRSLFNNRNAFLSYDTIFPV